MKRVTPTAPKAARLDELAANRPGYHAVESESVVEQRPVVINLNPVTLCAVGCAAVLLVYLIRTAWVAEDAYISFRVVDNFLNGFGLRWNIADRVQVYTDPLYLMLVTIATWISGNVYLASIAVSLILTFLAYFVITRGGSAISILSASVLLLFSKGFMDFSVSGLENPATHAALALYLYVYWRSRDPLWLSFAAALACTNRIDSLLLMLPSLAVVYWKTGRRVWKPALIGWSPFILWSAFALFYYGFFFPNTAYAKLSTAIPHRDTFFQGIVYYTNAFRLDSASMAGIAAGLMLAFAAREWFLGFGIILQLVYILWVGGDFMAIRFFTAPLFFAVGLIVRYWRPEPFAAAAGIAAIVAIGMSSPVPTVTSARVEFGDPWPVDAGGIADERMYYYPSTGLLRYHRNSWWPDNDYSRYGLKMKQSGKRVHVFPNVGQAGFVAGPEIHIIDSMGLGDAMMARLPAKPRDWRVGHYLREVPLGYEETITTGQNVIASQPLREYYDHLHSVISGDLISWQRFKDIVLMNLGYYNYLLKDAGSGPK